MAVMRVTFPARNATAFVNEVKERVAAYFAATGKSDKGGWRMLVKSAVLMGAFFALYFVLIRTSLPTAAVAGVALAMGILLAGVGFCISHDALHGAYSENPTVNKIVGYSFDVVGANGYMWQITHNVIHHTYTNIEGIDEDLAVSPLIRLSPSAPFAWYHRFQHLYAWVLYSFSTIFWVFAKDFKYFFARELGPYKDRKHARSEWVRLWVFKAIYYGWSVAIPLAMPHISLLEYLAVFFTVHLTGGLILGVVFQLAHVVEHIDYPEPEQDGAMPDDWMVHELRTTSDFGRLKSGVGVVIPLRSRGSLGTLTIDSPSSGWKAWVYVADGHAYFSRSSPRLGESLELLAHLLHPETFPAPPIPWAAVEVASRA